MHPNKIIAIMAILLVLVIAAAFYSGKFLSVSSEGLQSHILKIEDHTRSGNWEDVRLELENIRNDWSKTEKKWTMLLDHVEIDNIDSTLSRMEQFIETRNSSMALAEAATLKQYIKHIPEKEAFNLENLF